MSLQPSVPLAVVGLRYTAPPDNSSLILLSVLQLVDDLYHGKQGRDDANDPRARQRPGTAAAFIFHIEH